MKDHFYDQEFWDKHRKIVNELVNGPIVPMLDNLLVEMFNESVENGPTDKFYKLANKFTTLLIIVNDAPTACRFMNVALTVYCLTFDHTKVLNFELFHSTYGTYLSSLKK